jgi:glycosyltransferase involved in cell wall biosynthesis
MADAATISIVIPACNEAAVIGRVVSALRACAPWHEVLVIDDVSTDGTGQAATAAGARVVRHPYNKGNGAAVKTAIRQATGDWIIVVDGDGQHRPEDVLAVSAALGEYDLVVGARRAEHQASAGRRLGNALLNRIATYLTERPVPDLTSGLRGARRAQLREFLHLLPNGFSTPTTTTLAFIKAGYNVTFMPIVVQPRVGVSKIRLARDGARFLLILVKVITLFSPLRIFLPLSGASLLLGLAYGLWQVIERGRIPNGAVLLLMFGVMVFLVGLVSEQISSLRAETRD